MQQVKDACACTGGPTYQPKITFIVATKRHQLRIYRKVSCFFCHLAVRIGFFSLSFDLMVWCFSKYVQTIGFSTRIFLQEQLLTELL